MFVITIVMKRFMFKVEKLMKKTPPRGLKLMPKGGVLEKCNFTPRRLDGGDPGGFKHRGLGVFKSVNMLFFGVPNSLPFFHPPPIGMAVMPPMGPKKLLTRINNYEHPEFI